MTVERPNEMWGTVDEIVARAPDVRALRRHGLDLLAARRCRALGLDIDPDLRTAERVAALRLVAVPFVLGRVRAAVDGPLVLMKGPEAARSYAHPGCRPFKDLDILTVDAEAAQAALVRDGFVEIPGGADHHMPPLALPGAPVAVELHRAPHYVAGLPVPSLESLLGLTRSSRTGVAGIDGLVPAAHAVLLAVHSWAHAPFERIGHLIDVAAVLAEADRADADDLAERWGCHRLWHATTAAIDALLLRRAEPIPLRTWARHLALAREPTVFESYLARMLAPVWALPASGVVGGVGAELRRTTMPYEEESWADQLSRSRRALARMFKPLSEFRPLSTMEESKSDLVSARA